MSSTPRPRDQARWLATTAAMLAAVLIGFGVRDLWPKAAAAGQLTTNATVPVAATQVVRTDVAQRQVVPGTLGYQGSFGVVNELGAGVITWLPAPGQVVRRGQVLYQLAGQPVILMYGPVPAWRDLGPGTTAGSDAAGNDAAGNDVRELQRNLVALGFDPDHQIAADGVFGWATQAAVERWQQALGMTVTGDIPLGGVVFLPGALRVTGAPAAPGAPVTTGATVLSGTSDTPSVMVSLDVGGSAVADGDSVVVTMPDGTTTVPGRVSSVGRVATIPSQSTQSTQSGPTNPVNPVTIAIGAMPAGLDQAPVQVAITQQQDTDVLAVPVTALLARPGGGYAVRTAGATHRLLPVTTGLFDDATGMVEVAGSGLAAGLAVEVAQE